MTGRQVWGTISVKPSKELMSKLIDIYISETSQLKNVKNLLPSIVFQPINEDEIHFMGKKGGNCLGIEEGEGPLIGSWFFSFSCKVFVGKTEIREFADEKIVYSFNIRCSLAVDDAAVLQASENIIARSTALAKEMGLHHRYIYQNYAHITQDVFAGYGEKNLERLMEIQKKYDPEGVFGKRLQPGHFKL